MVKKTGGKRKGPARKLDLQIKIRTKSIVSLEWGCAYAFPVAAAQAIPLVVVSDLYRSPKRRD